MPKVISRSIASTSTDAKPTASSVAALKVLYCICGEFILVIDKTLAILPRRRTDGASVIRAQDGNGPGERKAVFKLNVTHADRAVMVERVGGKLERQYRFSCPRCALPIGYSNEPVKVAPFFYIHRGALTQVQGQVPTEAFEGDEDAQ
ncbi:hypothetical protein EXIGLDRAFT_828027 [Exidia glandulosa HHB12029]|uniref:STEEP1 domain-containing protein n=1 Tax=Exidia glandulosa HHB12029 TaxID=1314781 RepID=A0A165QUS4_EXIGL|nr:hypothetical protein EXIGLDRAFT_828027 [Exidia glandulosa HHB12029]